MENHDQIDLHLSKSELFSLVGLTPNSRWKSNELIFLQKYLNLKYEY